MFLHISLLVSLANAAASEAMVLLVVLRGGVNLEYSCVSIYKLCIIYDSVTML